MPLKLYVKKESLKKKVKEEQPSTTQFNKRIIEASTKKVGAFLMIKSPKIT